ncbi:MAG: DoxX family membrane protein [Deltaproteobacteria bacterium]|nr:DoxX family membrane protein [Deltaproteobacteria bacterium]
MNSVFNWPGHGIIALGARLYLGVVFIMASIHKILDPGSFAVDVATYEILPQQLINLMAICLPYVEIIAGILLVLGVKSRAGAWLVAGMMIMFMVALAIALYNGLDMSCGCFASSTITEGDEISSKTILRDSGWLFLAVYVLVFDLKPIGLVTVFQNFIKDKV